VLFAIPPPCSRSGCPRSTHDSDDVPDRPRA
jgi:hypothetical protein